MYGFDSTRFQIELCARDLLEQLEIVRPENMNYILDELGIDYFETSMDEGFDGALLCTNDNYGILINKNIQYDGRKRFTIAHELGHYWIPEHSGNFQCTKADIGAFDLKNNFELQADIFASEFLMPTPLFMEDIKYRSPDFSNFEYLANKYETSLTATSLKFIKNDETPCVLIYTMDGKIKWSVNSKNNFWELNYKKDTALIQQIYKSENDLYYDVIDSYYWFDKFKYDKINIAVKNLRNLNAQLIFLSIAEEDYETEWEEEGEY